MAATAWGKQVAVKVKDVQASLASEAVLRKIARRQADFVARQNRENAQRGLDRNGRKFPGYSPKYAAKRKKMGLQTGHVDLTVTGSLMRDFQTRGITVRRTPSGAELAFFLGVSEKNEGKLKGHTTGKYGKSKTIKKRDMIGLADASTKLGREQRERLERIAAEEIGRAGAALGVTITQRKVGT
jgi:hypothetical protein